jgi:thermitase
MLGGGRVLAAGAAAVLAVSAAALAAGVAPASPAPADQEFVPGELIVRFRPEVPQPARALVLRSEDAAERAELPLAGTEVVRLRRGASVEEAAAAFERHPEVLYAEPNWIYDAAVVPNDQRFGELWALERIEAPAAWDMTSGDRGVTVAVVDSGVVSTHPDLAPNVVPGWDFVSGDADPADQLGHGTHVAGTIGAHGNDGLGVAGVNWSVALLPIQVLSPLGNGRNEHISAGLAYAARAGAKVVNVSLGGPNYSQTMERAIREAPETLFVVAAGNAARSNDANPIYPCNFDLPNVICVGASGADDAKAGFSNYGASSVDLMAPGVRVVSTSLYDTYASLSGTSMAAPHVAGVAALIWARAPWASVAQVRSALLSTVDRVEALAGTSVTGGRLNARRAVEAAPAVAEPAAPAARRLPVGVECVVPRVVGRTVPRARRMLAAGHCRLGRLSRVFSSSRRGLVIRQTRRPGAHLREGARVDLVVSRGRRR